MKMTRSAALLLPFAIALGACGGSDDDVVDRAELEQEVQVKLTESVGEQAPKATCPDELVAKAGSETRCYMDFPERKRLGITVKVKSAEEGNAKFDIVADDQLGTTPN